MRRIIQFATGRKSGIKIVHFGLDAKAIEANIEAQAAIVAEENLLRQLLPGSGSEFGIERDVGQASAIFVEDLDEVHGGCGFHAR
jgi:hypothetical protein